MSQIDLDLRLRLDFAKWEIDADQLMCLLRNLSGRAGADVLAATSDVPNLTATIAGSILARVPGLSVSRLEEFALAVDNLGAKLARGGAIERFDEVERAYLGACHVVRSVAANLAVVNRDAMEQARARDRDLEERLRITMQSLMGSNATMKLVEDLFKAPGMTLSIDELIEDKSGSRVKLDHQKRNTMRVLCDRARAHLDDISAPLRIVRNANIVRLKPSD
jgi:hypothetical protein